MKATVMKQSIIIPDGKGGFIIKILKEGGIQGVLSTGILFKHLTGPIVLKLKNIMGFENAGIEDDIAINGTLFQRIVIFFMLEKLFFHHAGLKLQKTKSEGNGLETKILSKERLKFRFLRKSKKYRN